MKKSFKIAARVHKIVEGKPSKQRGKPSTRSGDDEVIIEQLRAIVAGEITAAHLGEIGAQNVLALIGRLEDALMKARHQLQKRRRK